MFDFVTTLKLYDIETSFTIPSKFWSEGLILAYLLS